MKIFNWIHGKIQKKQPINKPNSNNTTFAKDASRVSEKQEFSDWPNGLLAIGTFGTNNNNNNLKEPEKSNSNNLLHDDENDVADDKDQDFTAEQVSEIKKELRLLVDKHSAKDSNNAAALEKLFDCLNNIEDNNNNVEDHAPEKPSKDLRMESTHNDIKVGRKSLSFLFKKSILRRAGLTPPPPPLPPLPLPLETKFEKSRMEKILRAILHKKIYPQQASNNNTRTAAKNKYLCENYDSEDETMGKKASDQEGSKWVKTDSDFIVLEI